MFQETKMNFDFSSSDSSSGSEEDVQESVQMVFNAMRQELSKCSVKNPQQNEKSSKFAGRKIGQHRRVLDTFNNSGSESSGDEVETIVNAKSLKGSSTYSTESLGYFIDKGPVTSHNTDHVSNNPDSNVVSFDLSNLETEQPTIQITDSEEEASIQNNDNEGNAEHSVNEVGNALLAEIAEKKKSKKKRHRTRNKKQPKKSDDALSSSLQTGVEMNDVYVNVDPFNNPKSKKNVTNYIRQQQEPEIMKKSVISDDYEKQDSIASTHVSIRQQKKQRKVEREKTKGGKWFNMPATEIEDERKHDLEVLQMRNVLDPKRFYKANDLKIAPKYFQFGRVVEDPTDFYSSRIPKRQRKSTIVEELLADSQFRQYNKRKYEEVQEAKRLGKGPYKHMKRLKKRKR
ncbi:deoxynucleotidyltransferase terminal-interacting protein 2-like [Mya arenaria]|uniref:deoxynucleotidyltransferase terminal-interacting protein 2-like n=1 Tax=Mya arenaria TaxID=6604 RepID=UPI0022E990CE|nr:deoxynucleotidyltransferase terminal-interacting protein 2-like [Mya arenaria]